MGWGGHFAAVVRPPNKGIVAANLAVQNLRLSFPAERSEGKGTQCARVSARKGVRDSSFAGGVIQRADVLGIGFLPARYARAGNDKLYFALVSSGRGRVGTDLFALWRNAT